jgi:hypothetical protein
VELAILVSILLAGVGMLGVIAWRERPERSVQTVELRFGTLTAETAAAMWGCVAGLQARAVMTIDVVAGEDGIRFFLRAAPQTLDTLRSQWRGILPSVVFEPGDHPPVAWRMGALLRVGGSHPVLRADASAESVAALLGSLQPLSPGEHLVVRWKLSAGGRPLLPDTVSKRENSENSPLPRFLRHKAAPSADHVRLLRAKYAGPVLAGVGVVAVAAGHPKRAAHLLSRVVSPLRSRGGAYGRIVAHRREGKRLARLFDGPAPYRRDLYSPAELVGAVALPVGSPQVQGLVLGTAPVLMPSRRIPSEGRVLGVSNWPGQERRLAQSITGGLSHALLAGPTGVGKSEQLAYLALQDIRAGRGVFLLDGKGDTAESLLARIPDNRRADVIAVEPGREEPVEVPGLRLFGGGGSSAELTAELVLGIFADLFRETWGPLSARWLRAGLLLTAQDSSSGLADLPFVFSDDAYRRRLVARLEGDVLARETWAAFERMSPAERSHTLAAPLQKVEELVGRRVVRSVVGQGRAAKLDMHDVLATGKIVIVSLNPAKLGTVPARLIAALSVFKLFEAIQNRAAIAPEARTPFFAYIDEPGVLGDIPIPIDDAYALARGLGVGLLLGVQSLTKLPAELRSAAMTNASTLIAWRQNNADAKLLAADLVGTDPEGLQNLGKFEAIMRIGLGPGDVAPPVSARTLPLPAATSDPEVVRRASAARYGVDPAEVDAALMRRHGGVQDEPEKPVGRLRRKP